MQMRQKGEYKLIIAPPACSVINYGRVLWLQDLLTQFAYVKGTTDQLPVVGSP